MNPQASKAGAGVATCFASSPCPHTMQTADTPACLPRRSRVAVELQLSTTSKARELGEPQDSLQSGALTFQMIRDTLKRVCDQPAHIRGNHEEEVQLAVGVVAQRNGGDTTT